MKQKIKIYRFSSFGKIPQNSFTFTLGEDYIITLDWFNPIPILCRFIKTTRKGFNLLDLGTSKCILKTHMYSREWSGKDIPRKETTFKVKIPNYIRSIKPIDKKQVI